MVSIIDLVPEDHLVRKVSQAMDFSFVYALVRKKYSKDNGRPSIDPVVLVKMVLIQYLFGIRSWTCQEKRTPKSSIQRPMYFGE